MDEGEQRKEQGPEDWKVWCGQKIQGMERLP